MNPDYQAKKSSVLGVTKCPVVHMFANAHCVFARGKRSTQENEWRHFPTRVSLGVKRPSPASAQFCADENNKFSFSTASVRRANPKKPSFDS